MAAPLPLNISIVSLTHNTVQAIPGRQSGQYGQMAENLTFSNLVNGGFGTAVFRLRGNYARRPPEITYLADVAITDYQGATLFEGAIQDIRPTIDTDQSYIEIEAVGYQFLLDNPYQNLVVRRDIPWQPRPFYQDPANIRPDLIGLTIGRLSADTTQNGVGAQWRAGQALVANQHVAVVYQPTSTHTGIRRLYGTYDLTDQGGIGLMLEIFGMSSATTFAGPLFTTGPGTGTGSWVIDVTSAQDYGLMIAMICTAPNTPGVALKCNLYDIRVLGSRVTPTGTIAGIEPVYGYQVVSDVLAASQLTLDYSYIDQSDTSYSVQQASWTDSTKMRDVIEFITAYYNNYWAVWEGKTLYWQPILSRTQDYLVRTSVARISIDATATNAANIIRLRYVDQAGFNQEQNVQDIRDDNIYTLAGMSKTDIVDLGVVSNSTVLTQIGAIYFPDHSYEVVSGSVTIAATAGVFDAKAGNTIPAYRIRAGRNIRVSDAVPSRDIVGDVYDRQTQFFIKSVDVDWESQTVTLSIDNQRNRLTQLIARLQSDITAKFGGA